MDKGFEVLQKTKHGSNMLGRADTMEGALKILREIVTKLNTTPRFCAAEIGAGKIVIRERTRPDHNATGVATGKERSYQIKVILEEEGEAPNTNAAS